MRSFILKSHVHTGHVEYLTHCFKVVVFSLHTLFTCLKTGLVVLESSNVCLLCVYI